MKESVLREGAEAVFREIAENIRDVVWMTDPSKASMVYVSPSYEKIWGRTCESLHSEPRSWIDAIHADDRDRVMLDAHTKQETGEYDVEYRIVRPDGAVRWIHDRAFPIAGSGGKIHRIVGLAEDITERKIAEREKTAREREAFERDLLAEVSHELRTPLTAIKGYAETLRRDEQKPARLRFIAVIERHADRLARLVDNLLIVALMRSGKRRREVRDVGLRPFCADLAADLEPLFARRKIELKRMVPNLMVKCDPGDLHHILSNLLDNAVKHSKSGSTISLTARARDGAAEIAVEDHGRGIAKADLPRIFERFFRGASAKTLGGVGLGLAIVKELVEAQGGVIWAESAPGKGARFRFTVPLA